MSKDEPGSPLIVVAGAGVAGLAAGILLAEAGFRVVCVEPEPFPRARVGESLDWSAPALLAGLGLQRDDLIASGVGTHKREIRAVTAHGDRMIGQPPPWLNRWPFRFQQVTLHVDRERLDQRLHDRALDAGVEFIWDRITEIRFDGDRVVGCETRSGRVFTPDWFIDASGRRRLLARAAGIGDQGWGPPRISLWSHYHGTLPFEGTMLYLDESAPGLRWAWEIPIAEDRLSVGVVMALDRYQRLQRTGRQPAGILTDALARFPRFRGLSTDRLGDVRVRRFQAFVSDRVTGPNWVMTGESAAFVDPITSIGVTQALRHGVEAAQLLRTSIHFPGSVQDALDDYDRRVRSVADLYCRSIETLIYQPGMRNAFGIRWASRAYVPLGFLANAAYSRLQPTTRPRTTLLRIILQGFHMWREVWLTLARRNPRGVRARPDPDVSRYAGDPARTRRAGGPPMGRRASHRHRVGARPRRRRTPA